MRGDRRLAVARWAIYTAPVLIGALTAVTGKYPLPKNPEPRFKDVLLIAAHDWYIVAVITLSVIILAARGLQDYVGALDTRHLKGMVDTLHAAYFAEVPEGERYHNRVTLFKANRKQTELEAVCRSGTQYPRGIQPLLISDDNEAGNEGIAGQAWFTNSTVVRTDLPDCPVPCLADDHDCAQYASQGLLPISKAAKLHVRSRSLLATPVRDRTGARWGVLVLDSRRPDGIDSAKTLLATSIAGAVANVV